MAEISSVNSSTTSGTVLGYFDSRSDAQSAIAALQNAGFQAHEVGLAAHSGSDSATYSGSTKNEDNGPGFWDKVRDFFDGNSAEPYADERSRGDLATREITTADSGSNYGSSAASGSDYGSAYDTEDLHGSLSDLSVSQEHSRYFGDKLRNGGALVTVSAGNRRDEAIAILEDNGADVGEGASDYEPTAYANTDNTLTDTNQNNINRADNPNTENRNIRLYGEVLRVQKDRVNRGEVRIRKEVLTETQTVEVPVTREELVVERVAVTGDRAAAPDAAFQNEEIRIPLTEERARVEKQPVVVEEVRVGKREVSSVESLKDEVRREELKVEDETKSRAS